MHSPQDSSAPVIPVKSRAPRRIGRGQGRYRKYVGLSYVPPHGCFVLLARIYREEHGIDLEPHDQISHVPDNDARGLVAALHERLASLGVSVDPGQEQEGDVILLRTSKYHVGYVIEPGWMIHAYEGGSACIESYHSPEWRNTVKGFFRYCHDISQSLEAPSA